MKRLIFPGLFLALLLAFSMTAYAEENMGRYVPDLPPFVTVNGDDVTLDIGDIGKPGGGFSSSQEDDFFSDFWDGPYLILLEQWKAYGAEDKQWYVDFVKINARGTADDIGGFRYEGGTNGIAGGKPYYIAPMEYFPPSGKCSYFMYRYNPEKKKFDSLSMVFDTQATITFSYVLGCSGLTNPVKTYPYFNKLTPNHFFEVGSVVSGIDRHYDWWLGKTGPISPDKPEIDVDTDGDGKPDLNVDTDKDGKPDLNVDTDGDGKPDLNVDTDKDGKPDLNVDTDGDGKPDLNVDTDKDGKPDLNVDTDKDGKPDLNVDTDKDGKPDLNVDTDKDGKPDLNVDTDKDGKPDLNVDTDKDKDGKPDLNVDTDKDGKPDLNVDTDKDGKPNINIDTNHDGKPDINIDTDKDGKPDINIDKDGNGKPDINIDSNGDGKPDINIDTSGDGNADTNVDTDGDGKPDINIKPDGGGSGGGSGGGFHPGPDYGDDWFYDDDKDLTYDEFPIFNPFDYGDLYTPPPRIDYDPLDGYRDYNYMPEIPRPTVPEWDGYDPFKKPWL